MFLGQNIKNARIAKGFTQIEFAEALSDEFEKYTNTTVSNWENGISKPDAELIKNICIILDVDANYLYDFENRKKELEQNKTYKKFNPIFNKIQKLPKENQLLIINTLNTLLENLND